ncbi:sensor histidine kinase [Nocardiopsis sediminis]|uniref:histidine kinase n=1 Tax=Nocardiopsis sediminis TaxID=1778267 RepID=A0ABV8FP44_9ACTN
MAATLLVTGLSGPHSATNLDLLGYALLTAGGLALAARRRAPVPVLAVTGLCAVGHQAAGFDVPAVAYLFAVYAAVREGHRIFTVAASVALLAALPLAALASGLHDTGEAFAQARSALEVAWLIAAGAAGEALRQAERRADEAERTREEAARHRADEERLHIARELHDSLTHQISVIKVQAEVAVHLARRRGEHVPESLLAIRHAGGEAARELRATLEALRDDGKTPSHGLDHVPALVERARATGLDATLTIDGQRHDVPAAVDRTAYRIVQESLTNIARHASAATATVRPSSRYGSMTTARPRPVPPRPPASGCSGCANGSRPWAVCCGRSRAARAASPSKPRFPWAQRHDPCSAGRRPAAPSQRIPRAPGSRRRHRGGGRGLRRE